MIIENQTFNSLSDFDGNLIYDGLKVVNVTFNICHFSNNDDIRKRSIIRNSYFENIIENNSSIGPAIIEDVTLKT